MFAARPASAGERAEEDFREITIFVAILRALRAI
jgi:hypothetical protein